MKAYILPLEKLLKKIKKNKQIEEDEEKLEHIYLLEPLLGIIFHASQFTAITVRKIVID